MHRLAFLFALALSASGASCATEETAPPPQVVGAEEPETAGESEDDVWEPAETALGERVYVPIYSHIYFRDSRRDIDLAATLSIRNTDDGTPIRVTAVRYYDSGGALVRRYVDAPIQIGPMASTDFLVEQQDDTGGVGANFIVEWRADEPVAPPVIEAVMISASSSQGISFVTDGRVLHRARPGVSAASE